MGKSNTVVIDDKEKSVEIKNLQEFLDELVSAYTSATQEYDVEFNKPQTYEKY